MAKPVLAFTDVFTEFFPLQNQIDGGGALTEVQHSTGLQFRGGVAWAIHAVEWVSEHAPHRTNADTTLSMALCTRKGLVAMPVINDPGVVSFVAHEIVDIVGAGAEAVTHSITWPYRAPFDPPLIFAHPNISFYTQERVAVAGHEGDYVYARVHFTTVPLDAEAALEVAETWGYTP